MTYWVGNSVKMNKTLAETVGFVDCRNLFYDGMVIDSSYQLRYQSRIQR